jgi:4-amino-4-deoxy-L-arabinose transferase-like glycosyltransferase
VLLAALAALLVASPWYVALAWRGDTELLYELIVRQNFSRFVDPWDHQAPFWYYLVYFWTDMAPWSFFVPLAWKLRDREPDERRLDRLAWCWILTVLVFFSLSASKRSAYLLPLAPAVALLASGLGHQLLEGRLSVSRRRAVWAVFGFLGAVLLASAAVLQLTIGDYPAVRRPATAAALLLLAGGVAVFTGLFSRRARHVVPAAFASLVLSLYLLSGCWLLPAVDAYKSARPFARDVLEQASEEQPVRIYGDWKWRASYSYYTGRRLERLEGAEELRRFWDI